MWYQTHDCSITLFGNFQTKSRSTRPLHSSPYPETPLMNLSYEVLTFLLRQEWSNYPLSDMTWFPSLRLGKLTHGNMYLLQMIACDALKVFALTKISYQPGKDQSVTHAKHLTTVLYYNSYIGCICTLCWIMYQSYHLGIIGIEYRECLNIQSYHQGIIGIE